MKAERGGNSLYVGDIYSSRDYVGAPPKAGMQVSVDVGRAYRESRVSPRV